MKSVAAALKALVGSPLGNLVQRAMCTSHFLLKSGLVVKVDPFFHTGLYCSDISQKEAA